MSRAAALYQLMRADFFERVRRYGFLVTMVLILYLGYAVADGKIGVRLGDCRGTLSSAWVGTQMALVCSTLLSLVGFYLVKNAVERDRRTGVGEILATTPIGNLLYLFGKALSNLAVLAVLVGVLGLWALATQIAGGGAPVDLPALIAPLALGALPAMALVAAAAVFFESVPWLAGGFGNVVYFFAWSVTLPLAIVWRWFDPVAMRLFQESLAAAVAERYPECSSSFSVGSVPSTGTKLVDWPGLVWTPQAVGERLAWVGVAALIVLAAGLVFHRFDPAREGRKSRRRAAEADGEAATDRGTAEVAERPAAPASAPATARVELTPLPAAAHGFSFFRMVAAELRLLLAGQRWWWYAAALGLAVAGLFAPLAAARAQLLAVAWLWPLLLWSGLGGRERREGTAPLVFSAAHALERQLPAAWLAGVALAVATGGTIGLRLLLAGDAGGLLAWTAGALFIPALALACGVLSGGSKLFEVVFTLLWYVGPMNHVTPLDYTGGTPAARAAGTPSICLTATALLLALAYLARRRQIRS